MKEEVESKIIEDATLAIKENSNIAIIRGNKFPGYFGYSPNDFSKEELIMILNIVYDQLQDCRLSEYELLKNYFKK
jgi:hypothetical protein